MGLTSPIPTLGYPSRSAAVVALAENGTPNRAIAQAIGVDTSTVAALLGTARRGPKSARSAVSCRAVDIGPDLLKQLTHEAERRGTSRTWLAREILQTVIEKGLYTAVLDERG